MPHSRFHQLPKDKQERIIEIAAREFAAQGFEGASLNRILELAGIGKGSAHSYFDDKVDIFVAVVQRYLSEVTGTIEALPLDQLDGNNFWSRLAEVYRQRWTYAYEHPRQFGAVQAATKLSKKALANESLASIFNQVKGRRIAIFKRGQAVGAVRTDLPDDLLFILIQTIDDSNDNWLLYHHSEFQGEEMDEASAGVINLLRWLLTP